MKDKKGRKEVQRQEGMPMLLNIDCEYMKYRFTRHALGLCKKLYLVKFCQDIDSLMNKFILGLCNKVCEVIFLDAKAMLTITISISLLSISSSYPGKSVRVCRLRPLYGHLQLHCIGQVN